MDFSTLKTLSIPEGDVMKIECNGSILWELISSPTIKNWAKYSINADGSIYNNGQGYKKGYRIRSGGAEALISSTSSSGCTGYIPVKPNSVVLITGCSFGTADNSNAINISDSSFTNLGQMARNASLGYGSIAGTIYGNPSSVIEESAGVWKWIVPPEEYGVAYVRVTAREIDDAKFTITVDEPID